MPAPCNTSRRPFPRSMCRTQKIQTLSHPPKLKRKTISMPLSHLQHHHPQTTRATAVPRHLTSRCPVLHILADFSCDADSQFLSDIQSHGCATAQQNSRVISPEKIPREGSGLRGVQDSPDDGLRGHDCLGILLDGLGTAVKSHEALGNAGLLLQNTTETDSSLSATSHDDHDLFALTVERHVFLCVFVDGCWRQQN